MRRVSLAAAVAVVAGAVSALPAHADTATVYVSTSTAVCSDTDPARGSAAVPYCTLQTAVDAAVPGETLQLAAGVYAPLRITRSGTADQPIVLVGAPPNLSVPTSRITAPAASGVPAVDIDGASYVTLSGLTLWGTDAATVRVRASNHILLDSDLLTRTRTALPSPPPAALDIDGSTATSVTRDRVYQGSVLVHGQSQGTRLTVVDAAGSRTDGVVVDDAADTALTNVTVYSATGNGVVVHASATGTRIADSVLAVSRGGSQLVVDPAATAATTADHNVVQPYGSGIPYLWGGTSYSTAGAFTAATGQGAQDCAGPCGISAGQPQESSAAIDSEDPAVTGLPDTDVLGRPRVDDPLVGTALADGGTLVDRGAWEFQDPISASLTATPDQPPAAYPALAEKLQTTLNNPWGSQVTSYQYQLGDGSADVTTTDAQISHTYVDPGYYYPRVTVTTGSGRTLAAGTGVYVETPAPLTAQLGLSRTAGAPLSVSASLGESSTASGWPVTGRTVNWGDSTGVQNAGTQQQLTHAYAHPGSYQVTQTSTDAHGRTSQSVVATVVGSAFVAHAPVRLLDTRTTLGGHKGPLAANGTLSLKVTGVPGAPASGVTAVVLNLTSANPSAAGYLTGYSSAGALPSASSLNFAPHENRSNLVTVPVGPDGRIRIYAHVRTDVVADLVGYYATGTKVAGGSLLNPVAPVRVLDTRTTRTRPIASGETVKVPVRAQVGSGATSVILNVTVVGAGVDGYVSAFGLGKVPVTSSVNFRKGSTTAAQVIVPIGPDGTVSLYNHGGPVHLVADLQGWYAPDRGSVFIPVGPTRVMDTRVNGSPLPSGKEFAVATDVPQAATAVLLNLTATDPASAGYLTVHPTGEPVPTASTLNFAKGQTASNAVVVPVPVGEWSVWNHSAGVDVVADLQGWFG